MNRAMVPIVLGLVMAIDAPVVGEDPVRANLDDARSTFRTEIDAARDEVLAALRKKEDDAKAAGDLKLVERIRAEADAFTSRGEVPTLVATRAYDEAIRKARLKFEDAFKIARKAYTQAGKIEEAKAVDVELTEFQKTKGVTTTAPIPVGDPAARHRLRDQLDGTTWKWSDPKLKQNWFRLNADGTLTAGWHTKSCLWSVASGTTIKVQVTSERDVQELRVDLKAGTLTDVKSREVYAKVK